MLKLLLAITAVTSVLVTLVTESAIAQKVPPRTSTGHCLLERSDQDLGGRQSLHHQRGWHCDLCRGQWTAFGYAEC